MSQHTTATSRIGAYLPGLVLVTIITASAYGLRYVPMVSTLSPMIAAIFVGIMFANTVGVADTALAGIGVAGKRLLRISVAALGLQLTFGEIAELGWHGVLAAVGVLAATFVFSIGMGRVLGVERGLSQLLAGGSSICGASAVAAVNSVSRADDADVSYAIACITLFGTIAMLVYPSLMPLLGLDPHAYGVWVGLSVHEVAQVVGAGFQGGEAAGQVAVVTKLTRVLMLAPMIFILAQFARKRTGAGNGTATPIPLFVIIFLVLAALNSVGVVPQALREAVVSVTPVALTAALAALGLGTSFGNLKQRGLAPLLLAGLATLFISGLSLGVVKFII